MKKMKGHRPHFPKPPLGAMPEKLYEENRRKDLSRAINDRIQNYHYIDRKSKNILLKWLEELTRRIKNLPE